MLLSSTWYWERFIIEFNSNTMRTYWRINLLVLFKVIAALQGFYLQSNTSIFLFPPRFLQVKCQQSSGKINKFGKAATSNPVLVFIYLAFHTSKKAWGDFYWWMCAELRNCSKYSRVHGSTTKIICKRGGGGRVRKVL